MFGRQALLRIVERRCFRGGVLKGFERADGLVLIDVGPGVLQRLDPVACENCGIFSVPLLVAAITALPFLASAATEPPLALVVLTISCRFEAMLVAQLRQLRREMSGPGRLNLYSAPS